MSDHVFYFALTLGSVVMFLVVLAHRASRPADPVARPHEPAPQPKPMTSKPMATKPKAKPHAQLKKPATRKRYRH